MAIEKRAHKAPTVTVRPGGALTGHELLMRRMPAVDWIALRRGERDDGELAGLALEAIEDSSLPDGYLLDMIELQDLLAGWLQAHRDAAVPPANGTDSPPPSVEAP